MSNNPHKTTFTGKAARILLAGATALAFTPALPALAEDTQVTSWKDFYQTLGINTTTGYDAVTSATNFSGRHASDIPTIVHRTTNAEGATTSLDGFDSSAATAEKIVQVKLGSAEYEYADESTHGTGTFIIRPDDTVQGYTWNEYLNSTYAVTVSDGTTTVGTVPWVDYYGENSTSGYHYNKLEVALNNGTSVASNEANVTRFSSFYDENGNVKAGTYTLTVYAKGYSNLTATVTVLPTYAGAAVSGTSKASNSLCLSNLPSDIKDAKVTVSYTTGHGRNAKTTYLAGSENGGVDIPDTGIVPLDATALAAVSNDTALDVVVSNSNYAPIVLSSTVADTAVFPTDAPANTWKSFYQSLGIDTSTGYDAVTSATNFTSRHAGDIPTIVHKNANVYGSVSSLDGFGDAASENQVQVKLGSAEYLYQDSRGTGDFIIRPDDTVAGYIWNEYLNSVYAVTVSDGKTTAGAVPWIDYYGENSTEGYHYNKLEVAMNNGTSVGENQAQVTRFSKFYTDGTGQINAGTYTLTVYAKGYSNLTATVKVLPTYAKAKVSDASKAASALAISNLPSDIKDAKVTVSYTTGHGRNAVTTYLAGSENGGVSIKKNGTVALDKTALAAVENGTVLDVTVANSNYAPIYLSSTVADKATFPNPMTAKATKTKTVKAKKLKKKARTVKAITVSNPAKSKLSYKKKSGSKKLKVNKKNGKITVKKGTKKGTYKAKVIVTAKAGSGFAKQSRTVTVKIKVK